MKRALTIFGIMSSMIVVLANSGTANVKSSTNLQQAELMLTFLQNQAKQNVPSTDLVNQILEEEGTQLIIGQLNLVRTVNFNQYKTILQSLGNESSPAIVPVNSSTRAQNGMKGLKQVRGIMLWGVQHVSYLKDQLDRLRSIDVANAAKSEAEKYLPASLSSAPATFIVMGGRAGAAALENGIYLDILAMSFKRSRQQLPYMSQQEAIDYFAHEMHHVGAGVCFRDKGEELDLQGSDIFAYRLLCFLVAEGSATYLISLHRDLNAMAKDLFYAENFANRNELITKGLKTFQKIMNDDIREDEAYNQETSYLLGSGAHVLGSMFIDAAFKQGGLPALMEIIKDPRKLLVEAFKSQELDRELPSPELALAISRIGSPRVQD